MSFDLFYGTDPNWDASDLTLTGTDTFNSNWSQLKLNLTESVLILLALLTLIRLDRTKRIWRPVRIGLFIGIIALQASCGGGGGDNEILPSTSVPSTNAIPFTNVVTDIYDTEYQVDDLLPGTQYYWKIVVVDNWGNTYESLTQGFRTLDHTEVQ